VDAFSFYQAQHHLAARFRCKTLPTHIHMGNDDAKTGESTDRMLDRDRDGEAYSLKTIAKRTMKNVEPMTKTMMDGEVK
jgi:hypothetical protein